MTRTSKPPVFPDLLPDLANHLAGQKIGQFNLRGIYKTFTPPAIYFGTIPDEAGYAIAINQYDTITNLGRDTSTPAIKVQFRARGDKHPHSPGKILDRIYQELHDRDHFDLDNATTVLRCIRHLRGPEEQDTQGRWTRADSYTFTLNPQGE